jgi:hypothetical protein
MIYPYFISAGAFHVLLGLKDAFRIILRRIIVLPQMFMYS